LDRVIAAYGQQHGLKYSLFRPFNWIGSGLDNLHSSKEGSSRVVTQFLGHIVRGEDIKLVDGGMQRRSFTDVSDGISALIKIIENEEEIADGKIYNIGNPANDLSIKELAELMLEIALQYPEFEANAVNVNIVEVTSAEYYGKGYQDIKTRVPYIGNTCEELNWLPKVGLKTALLKIMDAYQYELAAARALLNQN